LTNICTRATLEIETAVLIQEEVDDKVEKGKKERAEKIVWEWKEIMDAEHVLVEKRQTFHDAQKDRGNNEEEIDKDKDKDDKGAESQEEQLISPPSAFPLNFSSMTLNNYIRERPRSQLKVRQNKSPNVSCSR
jgi:hypothetical protein